MTSKNSLFENAAGGVSLVKLLAKIIRRNIWLPLLALIGFLLNLPVATALIYNAIDNENVYYTYQSDYFAAEVMMIFQICSSFIIIVGAVLAAFTLFRYLHVRSQVDFYHSLPIRREKFFAVNWLAGFLVLLVPYAAAHLLNLLMLGLFGMLPYLPMDTYFVYILFNILGYALMFSLAVLAMLLSGNMPGTLKILTGIYGLCPAIAGVFMSLASIFYSNYVAFSDTLTNGLLRASVLERYCWLSWLSLDSERAELCAQDWIAGILLLAGTVAVSLLLYKKRNSECAGSTLAFRWQKPLFKYPYVVLFGLLGGIMFYAAGSMSPFWAAFGAIIATLFTAQLMEIFINNDFRAIRRGWRAAFASVLVVGVLLAYYGLDLGGFDKWQVEADAVERVQVEERLLDTGMGSYSSYNYWEEGDQYYKWSADDYAERYNMLTFSEPANVAAVVSILNSPESRYEFRNADDDDDYYYTDGDSQVVEVVYHMKNGRTKVRRVFCGGMAVNEQAYLTLLASDEWRAQLFLNKGMFVGKNVMLEGFRSFVSGGNEAEYAPNLVLTEAQSNAFYETYKREFAALSAEELLKSMPLGRLQVGFYTEKVEDNSSYYEYKDLEYAVLYIYSGMTETIENLQYIYGENVLDTRYPAGRIESVREVHRVIDCEQNDADTPYYDCYIGETEVVRTLDPATDAAEIAKIYAATASEDRFSYVPYYYMLPSLSDTYYEFTYNAGSLESSSYAGEYGYDYGVSQQMPISDSGETFWTEIRYPLQ